MAEARQRLEALRFNKNLFRIISLLFLLHIGQSLDFRDYRNVESLVNNLQKAEELVTYLREVQSGTEFILILLDEAKFVANKKHLELFQPYLQEAVDEAHKQKVKMSSFTMGMQRICNLIMNTECYLKETKKSIFTHQSKTRLIEAIEQLHGLCVSYVALQKDTFNGKTKETETKLTWTLNILTLRKKILFLYEIKPVVILCILALCWMCSRICSCIFSYL
ncbi:uncharacterized protein LOC129373297 [Poeciliopsis prolifica]|uniref:uncharacterized protein LOC129373297 n=1 Tax=Poeciliopsis prolifica TaxID=188132 RepID=UPI0024138E81|nr:uncharacterized protein LOC129373297 [Poeciliopsis prolifica]